MRKSLKSRCKGCCPRPLLLCSDRKIVLHLKNNHPEKANLCVHNPNTTKTKQDQITLLGSQKKATVF